MGTDYWKSFSEGEDLCDVETVEELEASAKAIVEGESVNEALVRGFLSELGQWAGAYPPEEEESQNRVLAIIKLLEDFIK